MLTPIIHVLVIDSTRDAIDSFLALGPQCGLDVTVARDGETGLVQARQGAFDGIVIALDLPDIAGLQVLRRLRHENNRTPAVVLTGNPTIASALESGRLGAVEYFTKPPQVSAIASALRHSAHEAAGSAVGPPTSRETGDTVWSFARECLRGWEKLERAENADQRVRMMIDLLVDASVDVRGTTLPQFALLARIARHSWRAPRAITEAVRRELRVLDEAQALDLEPRVSGLACWLDPFSDARHLRESRLSKTLRVNVTTVGRELKRLFGCGFRELRRTSLVRSAVAPVALTSDPIGSVAISCGYDTDAMIPHFYRDWARTLRISPMAFRGKYAVRTPPVASYRSAKRP